MLINGYDSFNLTKLDVLDGLAEIKVGVAYEIDGKALDGFPGEGLGCCPETWLTLGGGVGYPQRISRCWPRRL